MEKERERERQGDIYDRRRGREASEREREGCERERRRRRDAQDTLRGGDDGDGDGDGDSDDDGSALSEASGERALVTENRSQPLATLSYTHIVAFGERDRLSRHAAVRSTPIVQGRHVRP